MTPKEQTRLQVLNSLLVEHMTLDQAATLMGVSPRHTRRILADYRKNGAASRRISVSLPLDGRHAYLSDLKSGPGLA